MKKTEAQRSCDPKLLTIMLYSLPNRDKGYGIIGRGQSMACSIIMRPWRPMARAVLVEG